MAYSGLETLFQNMGPAFASSMAGSREADAQYADMQTALKEAQVLQDAKQKYAQNAQMNPLLLAHQGLQNQGLQAQLPGQWADSSKKTTDATKAAATLPSDIAKGISANEKAVLEDKLAKNTTYMQMAQQFGAQLQASAAQGPGAQEAVRQQMVQQIGPDTSTGKWLASIPTQHLSTAIDKVQEHLVKQSGDYMKALMTAEKAKESRIAGARIAADASKYGTDARERMAALRQGTQKSLEDDISKNGKTFEARAGIYDAYARKARQAGDDALANEYAAEAERQRAQQILSRRAAVDASNELKINQNELINGAPKAPAAPKKELTFDPQTGTFK